MFKHYLTTALRHFKRHKATTAINLLCLTLGIGCFLGANGVATMLANSDRQFAHADRIYALTQKLYTPGGNVAPPTMTLTSIIPADLIRADNPELEAVSRLTLSYEAPLSYGDAKLLVKISHADRDFFKILDWPFLYGDAVSALSRDASVVLTQSMATQLFGSPERAMGKTVMSYGRQPLTVTAVVKPIMGLSHLSKTLPIANFDALVSMDIMAKTPMGEMLGSSWSAPGAFTYMLLPADGSLTPAQLQDRLSTIDERHLPKDEWHSEFGAVPVTSLLAASLNMVLGSDKSGITLVGLLYALGCLVLGVAAINYANLAAAQGITRAKETGLRRVLGAKRSAIALQSVSEAGFLVTVAAGFALLLACTIAVAVRPAGSTALNFVLQYALTQLPILAVVIVGGTALSSFYPAIILSRSAVSEALRSRRALGQRRLAPALLVAIQFAVTAFLLIAIFVMSTQFKNMQKDAVSNLGDPLVMISNSTQASGVQFDSLRAELLKQSHVQSVSGALQPIWAVAGSVMPISSSHKADVTRFTVCNNIVNRDFFKTLDIKLIAGRDFDPEIASDSVPYLDLVGKGGLSHRYDGAAVIIDRAFAKQQGWTAEQAIGKEIFLWRPGADSQSVPMMRVIGVVEDKSFRLLGLGATSSMYMLATDSAFLPIVRVDGKHLQEALRQIDQVWNQLAPTVAIKRQMADEVLEGSINIFVGVTQAFKAVAFMAIVIAVLGLIGMSIHIINRRTHEIGVRKTLGASVRQILLLLIKDLSKPVLIANLLAWPLAFGAMTVFLSIFVMRAPLTFLPFVVTLLITLVISWLAVSIQTTRAARLNPATVLRHE